MNNSSRWLVLLMLFLVGVTATTAWGGQVQLPQTGQTNCYDMLDTQIACTGTGQDGDIQAGVPWPNPRFNDNGDQTLTDNLTGLVWAKDAGAPTVGSCAGGNKDWQEALDYVACLNTNNYLGYSDWRLPNINELESLLNIGQLYATSWLSDSGFTNVQWSYVSSTFRASVVGILIDSWVVDMYTPLTESSGGAGEGNGVWPVRLGQSGGIISLPRTGQQTSYYPGDDGALKMGVAWPNPRLVDNGNGTVLDNLTSLLWTKDAGTPIIGACNAGTMTWQEALDYVACLNTNNYFGYSDWRLPNIIELSSLIDYSQFNPALPAGYPFVNVQLSAYYWTSDSGCSAVPANKYTILFNDGGWTGDWGNNQFNYKNYSWPVRGGQVIEPTCTYTYSDWGACQPNGT